VNQLMTMSNPRRRWSGIGQPGSTHQAPTLIGLWLTNRPVLFKNAARHDQKSWRARSRFTRRSGIGRPVFRERAP